jgi:cytochrome c oxidase subunit 3
MNNGRKHLFHIVDSSPWPIISATSAFLMLSGLAFYMHRIIFGGYFFFCSIVAVGLAAFFWFNDIIKEAGFAGHHSLVVRSGLRWGFLLFILSEIMLFFGFFWAFFHSSFCPSILLGAQWPPVGITIIPVMEFPLFNTFLLIISGVAITWAHRGIALGSFREALDGFLITIILGFLFVILQMFEYYEAFFNISDSVYSTTFYTLTGLHGMHVIVGACFITICFVRLLRGHFLTNHYLGFIFAVWYWHFVDVVWILLFLSIYCWGSW